MTRIIVRAMNSVCCIKVTNTDNYADAASAIVQYMEEGYKRIDIFECNKSVAIFYELEDKKWKII
jgi:hypothetical protein